MATDSTLYVSRDELRRETAFGVGWSRTWSELSLGEQNIIDEAINTGLRQFYFPIPLPGKESAHIWSFLKPREDVTLWPTVAASSSRLVTGGTYDAPTNTTPLAVNTATFYESMIGKTIVIVGTGSFTIVNHTSTLAITVSGNASAVAAATFSITSDNEYTLPWAFAGMEGRLHYASSSTRGWVEIVSDSRLRAEQQRRPEASGVPRIATIQPLLIGTTQQRFALTPFPAPDSTYTLYFKMLLLPNALTTNAPYAYGGVAHAETVKQSCMAAAEWMLERQRGAEHARFMDLLAGSISHDCRHGYPDNYGYNADRSDGLVLPSRGDHVVTYEGVEWGE